MLNTGITALADSDPVLSFSNESITETVSGSGYKISGTVLTIQSAGTYTVTGSCEDGSIEVKKGVSGVTLILDDLTLTASSTAPISVKKGSEVTIQLEGSTTLTDAENPDDEKSTDADVADAFEGAAIKIKSGSTVTFCGDGTLTADGSAVKNGIKGASESSVIFNGGTYYVKALNNGIAADGTVTINGGTFVIDAENDGIKSVPDEDDDASEGSVYINGGTFHIEAGGDGIQANIIYTFTAEKYTSTVRVTDLIQTADFTFTEET